MSSAQIVHNTTSSIRSQDPPDPARCAAQAPAAAGIPAPPSGTYHSGAAADDKRFTTAYGMVVWPTLPGLSSASETPAKPAAQQGIHSGVAGPRPAQAQALLPGAMAMSMAQQPSVGISEPVYAAGTTKLLRAACDACHRMKRKCDGRHPCTRCERRNRDCFYSCKQKSGPPKGSKRKLVEAEDDLPENRPTKPNVPMWSRSAMMSQQNSRTPPPTETKPIGTAPAPGPSPEARAAAAAAVAATRMNALAPAVPPAMTAAGMHPQYMLRPPPVLPGLSSGSVPVGAPLVAHPRYGTVYQHQYPPEVYAVYLAELRHRSASVNIIGKDNFRSDVPVMPAPISGRLGDMGAASAEAAKAAATALAADVAAAGGFTADTSVGHELASTGSELLSEAANFVEQRAGVGEQSGPEGSGEVVPDREALDHVSKMAAEGWGGSCNEPAKEAAASAAASAALAAAVAAAIAEGSRPDARDESNPAETANRGAGNSSSGIDFADTMSPAKGTRFDAVPEMRTVASIPTVGEMPAAVATTVAMVKSEIEGYSCGSGSRAATQRERQAAAGLLLYGVNSRPAMPSISATTMSDHHPNGGAKNPDEGENVNVKAEGELQHCQRNSPNAAAEFPLPRHAQDDMLAA